MENNNQWFYELISGSDNVCEFLNKLASKSVSPASIKITSDPYNNYVVFYSHSEEIDKYPE